MLAIVLDGMDNQLLGNAIPALMRAWSLPRRAFTTALAMDPLGMMVGGVVGGMLRDRVGRRPALLLSVVSFAVPTLAIATAGSVTMLGVFRFCAGLGLGGAMPLGVALVLFRSLPESPGYLATRRERWPELVRLLGRLGHEVAADAAFASASAVQADTSRGAIGTLFTPELRRDTLGL